MTNNEEYEKALNESLKAYRNAVKDNKAAVPQGYGVAFNYGYTFGLQQANAEKKESAKREIDFQREHIAIAAMQGMIGSRVCMRSFHRELSAELDAVENTDMYSIIAKNAVLMADALINELSKPKDENNN